jgi:hypothetical protein
MRRRALAAAFCAALASFGAFAPRPARAGFEIAVALRMGYVFGRGITIGSGLSVFGAGIPTDYFVRKQTALTGGLALSADVLLEQSSATYRLRAGPEVGAVSLCPGWAGSIGVGPVLSLRRGERPRAGFDVGASLLGALLGSSGRSGQSVSWAGAEYHYAEQRDDWTHELGFEYRFWTLSLGLPAYEQSGICGLLGKNPERFLGVHSTPVEIR